MKSIVIETKRLVLRTPMVSDAKKVLYIYKEKYLSKVTHIHHPYSLSDAKKFLKRVTKDFGKGSYNFFIILKETNKIIGSLGIVSIDKRDNRGTIGYVLAKQHRNKGYMTEACSALLDFAFRKLKLNRININHVKGNEASRNVILKIGAKYEGTERNGARTADGRYKDHLLYAILAKDWLRKK